MCQALHMLASRSTHDVLNQAAAHRPVQRLRGRSGRCARRWSASTAAGEWTACATPASSPAASRRSSTPTAAERNEPILRTHDRYGRRIDEVELDPSWHWLLRQAVEREIHCLPWREEREGAHVVRAGLMYVWSQVNARA